MILLASNKYNLLVYSMESVMSCPYHRNAETVPHNPDNLCVLFDETLYSIYNISILVSKSSKRDHLSVCLSVLTFCIEITLILKALQKHVW